MAKSWPEDRTELVDVEKLIGPVVKLYLQARRSPGKDFVYEGYAQGHTCAATCLGGDDLAKFKVRAYGQEDQGRSVTEQFMALVFQLGFEQGYRHKAAEYKPLETLLRVHNERELVKPSEIL